MNHNLCLAGYAWKPCELLKRYVEHNSCSLFLYIFLIRLTKSCFGRAYNSFPPWPCSQAFVLLPISLFRGWHPPELIPFGSRPLPRDSIFPLIKRWHAWLSTPRPQSPSTGCTVTRHTCHFRGSLIPTPQGSKIRFSCRRAMDLGARAPAALPVGASMDTTPCLSMGGRAEPRLHMAATAATGSDLNFGII